MEGRKMNNARVLMMIAAFLALTLGSFIWFIVTWDPDKEQPVGMQTPSPLPSLNIPAGGHAFCQKCVSPRNERAPV